MDAQARELLILGAEDEVHYWTRALKRNPRSAWHRAKLAAWRLRRSQLTDMRIGSSDPGWAR